MSQDVPPFIQIKNVQKSYNSGAQTNSILRGVDLQIGKGQQVAILGPSGCGKSTLLHLIAGLDHPDSGSIEVGDQLIQNYNSKELAAYRRNTIGILFQFFHLFSALSVIDNILLPTFIRRESRSTNFKRAQELAERVGLSHRLQAKTHQLSGGEMQRVSLCRALIHRPALLLADEPTGNLDSHHRKEVYHWIHSLAQEEKMTVLMVSHDPEISQWVDRIVQMEDGRLQ